MIHFIVIIKIAVCRESKEFKYRKYVVNFLFEE